MTYVDPVSLSWHLVLLDQLAQTSPSSASVKEKIDALKTMIKEHDQHAKAKSDYLLDPLKHPKNEIGFIPLGRAKGFCPKVIRCPIKEGLKGQIESRARSTRYKGTSLDSNGEGYSEETCEDLNPKSVDNFEEMSQKFLEEFSQQKRYSRDPTDIHELAKKLNDKISKTVDEMFERLGHLSKVGRQQGRPRSVGTCAPYSRRETFAPLIKTPKEIIAMESVNFPPPPPLIGTSEKQNVNKFCDYHGDKGNNTNDCYHLKKQIEDNVA
nr:reverse transcriptase domain-containing protein [Tanacetum cinerariifolium]